MLPTLNLKKYIKNIWNSMTEAEKIHHLRKWKLTWRILWENFVFQDGNHFYKMPTFLARNIMYRRLDSYEKICSSLKTIQQYFWPLTKIPHTEILHDEKHYIIKQVCIDGEKLTRKHLEASPKLLSKFKRLIIANEIMWLKEWVFLDLLGSDIILHPNEIHNLLTDGENIYVFDFWLLEKSSHNLLFRYFSHFAQKFQLFIVKYFF